MRLRITVDGVALDFVEPRAHGAYPWLTSVGTLLLAASGGHLDGPAVGEGANVSFELNNDQRQAAILLGRPVRAPAALFDDDDEELFVGLISTLLYGVTLQGTVEA